ncbi:DUF3106 domain-containing protein [Stenotrophomonas sp. 169]|jgi:hypothetical protein|uniref:DUF3106 domain-containing protein n=1 Tax=Stenotrophomonas sp. 169 TaxID=2770322 RepID=UPI0016627F7F|nr:DUF3106 domain-containing protein [Stenotrophomonas sp. 169]QNR96950.1 DUF3106 domain-containing protein [Stenotrophomonas sp. 169]
MNKSVGRLLLVGMMMSTAAQAAPDRNVLPLSSSSGPAGVPVTPAPALPAWDQLSPEQKRQRRSDYAAWRSMSESERQRVRQAAGQFSALPPARQQALRDSFTAQDQAFRDGWRLGPLLGEHFGRLQGMFGYVPEDQRDATLAMLRQLTPAQVSQLTLVAQRTPPQQRDAVRSEFLAVAPAQRDAWLTRQVGR